MLRKAMEQQFYNLSLDVDGYVKSCDSYERDSVRAYSGIVFRGVLYENDEPVCIENRNDLYKRPFKLSKLGNRDDVIDSIVNDFNSLFCNKVKLVDFVGCSTYVRDELLYHSNGAFELVMCEDVIREIRLSEQAILNSVYPYPYLLDCMMAIRNANKYIKYRDGKYYTCTGNYDENSNLVFDEHEVKVY